jgi:hypothetical protein
MTRIGVKHTISERGLRPEVSKLQIAINLAILLLWFEF